MRGTFPESSAAHLCGAEATLAGTGRSWFCEQAHWMLPAGQVEASRGVRMPDVKSGMLMSEQGSLRT